MTDRLSMSLDAIIQEKKTSNPKPNDRNKKYAGGKARGASGSREQRKHVPYLDRTVDEAPAERHVAKSSQPNSNKGGGIFSRIGTVGGTVAFSNLKFSVTENDMKELCSAVGSVTEIKMGKGAAQVTFSKKAEANNCVERYNGLALDGRAMGVTLKSDEPTSVFSRLLQAGASQNVKEGIFGTSLEKQSFKVNLGGGVTPRLVQPTGDAFANSRKVALVQPTNNGNSRAERGNGGNRAQQKGNKGKSQGNRRDGPKKPVDLDADLDDYMNKGLDDTEKEAKVKGSLDDDLDSYMAARGGAN
jgi:hypothetical protein